MAIPFVGMGMMLLVPVCFLLLTAHSTVPLEDAERFILEDHSKLMALGLWVAFLLIIPVTAGWFILKGTATQRGLLFGLLIGLWCNCALVLLPYLGFYPSLPSVLAIAALERVGLQFGAWGAACVMCGLNLALWSLFGSLAARAFAKGK